MTVLSEELRRAWWLVNAPAMDFMYPRSRKESGRKERERLGGQKIMQEPGHRLWESSEF